MKKTVSAATVPAVPCTPCLTRFVGFLTGLPNRPTCLTYNSFFFFFLFAHFFLYFDNHYTGPINTENCENLSNSFPFSAIPLLISSHPDFQMVVNSLIDMVNHKYEQLQGLLDDNRHEVRSHLH